MKAQQHPKRVSKYKHLLKNESVKEWFENVSRGSKITAEVQFRRLGCFCRENGIEPIDMISMEQKKLDSLVLRNVTSMLEKGNASSYVKSHLEAIKSWLSWNDRRIGKNIKLPNANHKPTLKNEVVPSQEELRKILNSADSRERVAIGLVAFSGVRLEVLGNYEGSDGLKIGDFPELAIEGDKVTFSETPAMIVIREELSKTGNRYFSFLGAEGCQYLKAYIETRLKHGEQLSRNSPLIVPVRREPHHIRTINIGDMIRGPMRLAGNLNRPYVLRSYFATQLMQAESKGFLRDWRTFVMGHKGDIEHTYTLNRNQLPKELIQKMRVAYLASLEFLETHFQKEAVDKQLSHFYADMATKIYHIDSSMVQNQPLDVILELISERAGQLMLVNVTTMFGLNIPFDQLVKMGRHDLAKLIREKIRGEESPKSITEKPKQKLIDPSDLGDYLEQGFRYIAPANGRLIVEK